MPFANHLGEILALVAALSWSAGVILFRKLGDDVPAVAMNLFKNLVTVVLLALTLVATGTPFVPARPASDWVRLVLSGLLGIAAADTLFFMALTKLGAGLVAVVDTLYSPAVIGFSVLFLGERVGVQVLAGAVIVGAAILVGSADRPPAGRTRRDIVEGTILGALAILLMAGAIVMVKDVLDASPLLWAAEVRMAAGVVGLLPLLLHPRWRRRAGVLLRPGRAWALAIPASVLGAYLSMTAWLGGFKFTLVSVAAILNQLSTIFIFLLAAVFLKEPLSPRRTLAVVMAVAGALLVALR